MMDDFFNTIMAIAIAILLASLLASTLPKE